VTSDTTDYMAISLAYRSAIQCHFPAVLKRDGLSVSNHVICHCIDRPPYQPWENYIAQRWNFLQN